MSLIKEKDKDLLAVNFFKEVLIPLALRERSRGNSFFPLRADPQVESYYVEPTHSVMTASDFELPAAESIEAFINELAALWIAEGHKELVVMMPGLSELAAEICEQEKEEEDVSAFMYVMF